MRRIATLLAAAVTVAAVTGACEGDSRKSAKASADKPFKVLMVQDLSGPLSSLGKAEVQGMKASAAVLNAQGGIRGKRIQIDEVDDQSDPTKAVSLLTERITKGDIPDLVQGGTSSNETLAMLPIETKHKIMYFGQNGAAAINDPQRYPYAFSMAVLPTVTADVVATYSKEQGYKKIGLMVSNSAAGQSLQPLVEAAFKERGLATMAETFEPTALDMTPQLEALRAQGLDALVTVNAFGRAALTLLKSRQKLGWNIPTVGDTALAAQDLAGPLGADALQNVFHAVAPIQQFIPPERRAPAFTTFMDALKAQGPVTTSLNVYSQSYDELQILNVAANQAQSTDVQKLSAALESLKAPNPMPWVTYKQVIFSKKSHFIDGPPEQEQVVIPAGPIVDGMFIKS
jgi:branched-chain amino acid transport system substrate-binding protein